MTDNICAYCGEDKRQNPEKHLSELAGFMMKQIEECQRVIKNIWMPEKEDVLNETKKEA